MLVQMNTKHMFPVQESSTQYLTHAALATGEYEELTGNKVDFSTLRMFRKYLSEHYPDNQIPQNQPLIIIQFEEDLQEEEHPSMIAEGPLSELHIPIIEPTFNPYTDISIYDAPTKEEIANSTLDLNVFIEDVQFEETPNVNSIINPLNSQQMNATMNAQPVVETTVDVKSTQPTVSFMKKVQWYSAVGAGHTVIAITGPSHFLAQTLADTFQAVADGIATTEAFSIDKLCIASESRAQIKLAVAKRTREYQSYATAPFRAVNNLKNIVLMASQANIQVQPAMQS